VRTPTAHHRHLHEQIGPLTLDLGLAPALDPGGRHTTWNPVGTVVTITHSGLAYNQAYAASVAARDASANLTETAYTGSFTTRPGSRLYLPIVVRYH
jgi:hypothetical protein